MSTTEERTNPYKGRSRTEIAKALAEHAPGSVEYTHALLACRSNGWSDSEIEGMKHGIVPGYSTTTETPVTV